MNRFCWERTDRNWRSTGWLSRCGHLVILLWLCAVLSAGAATLPVARRGVIDLRTTDLSQQEVQLKGEWQWYWHRLLTPGQADSAVEYTDFPIRWSDNTWRGKPVPSQGFATYSLTVLLPRNAEPAGVEIPSMYTSYRLFANDQELAHDGKPGTTAESTVPHWSTQLVALPQADTVRLLVQVANFHHAKGGPYQAIRLGEFNTLRTERNMVMALDVLLTGCMLMSCLFFLGLFSFNRHERSLLYFSMFCLVYSYRVIGTGTYVLHLLFPNLPWAVTTRLEYLSLYLSVAVFGLYTRALYPAETHRWLIRASVGMCLLFAATVALPTLFFTRLIPYFQLLAAVCLVYATYVYWMAAHRRRPGAAYSLFSTGILLLMFTLLLIDYFDLMTLPMVLLITGYLTFFFCQSLVLSYRFGHAINESRRTEKQFLANMSHEIRTPLNAILGFSAMLETTQLDTEQQEAVGFVRSAGRNLLTIVNDILDISKIEAGMLSLESIPFSLTGLVDSLRTMMNPVAVDKGLQLLVDVDPALPTVVQGDPTRLTQILLNLLSNAIKFTRQGHITVRLQLIGETDDTVRVRVVVQDTGIGMNGDVLPHIFERFRQASDFTTRYYGGTGLGLNIVRSLVDMQGGSITVTSKPGSGSCFTLEIPYQKSADQQVVATNWTDDTQSADAQPLTILIVEDNVMNQKLAMQVLKRMGHVGVVAENGQQAIERIQQHSYDLVLMDIQMPVMDGYTTTRLIRTELRSKVPIIAMTAHALASERERCIQAGMNDFLPKPFQLDELQRIIRTYTLGSAVPAVGITAAVRQTTEFSFSQLLASTDDDLPFAIELLNLFLSQAATEISQIRGALAQADLTTIRRVLHTQKGPIQTFGLAKMVAQNLELESMLLAVTPTLSVVAPLVNDYLLTLEAELSMIKRAVEEQRSHLEDK